MVEQKQNIYFLSDAHLGSLVVEDAREHEMRLVRFLDKIKSDAKAIYLLGDMFDFWFEYRKVVPKGFVRFLGKIAELSDSGIEIHFFVGNHDMWDFGYFAKELGIKVHYEPQKINLGDHRFFIAHGDGLGEKNCGVKLIQWIFHNKVSQFLFRLFPPYFGLGFGYGWSKSNREQISDQINQFYGENREFLIQFAKEHEQKEHMDFYVFGHRHILLDFQLKTKARVVVVGDWYKEFSYAKYDGQTLITEYAE